MNIQLPTTKPGIQVPAASGEWDSGEPLGYSCEIRVRKGEDVNYVAYVPTLDGVYGQGDDMESVVKDVTDALQAAIEAYAAEGEIIPWHKPKPADPGEQSLKVIVNA